MEIFIPSQINFFVDGDRAPQALLGWYFQTSLKLLDTYATFHPKTTLAKGSNVTRELRQCLEIKIASDCVKIRID